ncbi:MAG: beta strand repeat-containing protein [Phycisphaerales bacterium]
MQIVRDRRRARSLVREAGGLRERGARNAWEGCDALEARQHLAVITWDGGAGTNEWNDANNWSGNVVPGVLDEARILTAAFPEILVNSNVGSIAALLSQKPIRINGTGALAVSGISTFEPGAPLRLDGGTFTGGTLTQLNGGALWTDGNLGSDAGGSVEVPVGQAMTITTGGNHLLGTTLKNFGTLNWAGVHPIFLASTGIIRNEVGGSFNLTAINSYIREQGGAVGTSVLNLGTMVVNTVAGSTIEIGAPFYHRTTPGTTGLLVVQGKLSIEDIGENNQTIGVSTGAFLDFDNANGNNTFVHKNASYVGGGIVTLKGGIQQINGAVTFNAPTTATLGSITTAAGTTPRIFGTFTISGAMLNNADKLIVYGTLVYNSGSINGAGELSIFNTPGQPVARMVWNDGDITGAGLLKVYSTGKLQIFTGAARNLTRTLENRGTVVWGAGTIFLQSSGIINNFGTFEAKAPGAAINGNAGSRLRNHATMNVTIPSGQTMAFNCEFINNADAPALATLTVTGGTPWFNTQGTISDRLRLNSGAEIVFSGNASPGFNFTDLTTSSVNTSGVPGTQGKRVHIQNGTVTLLGTSTFGVQVVATGPAIVKTGANAGGVSSRVFGTLTIDGATLNTDKPLRISGTLIAGGVITGTDTLTISSDTGQPPARLVWLVGSIGGLGQVVIAAGQRLEISNAASHVLARTLTNLGTIIWNGGSIFLDDGGTLINDAVGATLGTFNARMPNGSILDASQGTPTAFINRGIFSVNITPGTSISIQTGFVFSNLGQVIVTQGTLSMFSQVAQLTGSGEFTLNGGRWTATGNSSIDFGFRAVTTIAPGPAGNATVISLTGAATFTSLLALRSNAGRLFLGTGANLAVSIAGFTFTNSGRLDVMPGANFVVALGNFKQTGAGQTNIGIASASSYGQIEVLLGTTEIAGLLTTQYLGGYVPVSGQTFAILTYTAGLVGQYVLQGQSPSTLAYLPGAVRLIML